MVVAILRIIGSRYCDVGKGIMLRELGLMRADRDRVDGALPGVEVDGLKLAACRDDGDLGVAPKAASEVDLQDHFLVTNRETSANVFALLDDSRVHLRGVTGRTLLTPG